MNLFVKLMLCALVIAIAGPFFLKGSDGNPLIKISELAPDIAGSLSKDTSSLGNLSGGLNSGKSKVYRWVDENGLTQLSDSPPMESLLAQEAKKRKAQAIFGNASESTASLLNNSNQTNNAPTQPAIQVQEIVLNSNSNVIQSLSSNKINKALGRSSTGSTMHSSTDSPKEKRKLGDVGDPSKGLSLTTVPLDKVGQLMEDAKAAKAILETRTDKMDSMINQI